MVGVGADDCAAARRGCSPAGWSATPTCWSCATRSRPPCSRRRRPGAVLDRRRPGVGARRRARPPSSRPSGRPRTITSPSATSPGTARIAGATWRPRCARRSEPTRCNCNHGRSAPEGATPRVADSLRELLGSDVKVLDPPDEPRPRPPASYRGDDLVIAMRFHALVAAGMAGTPFVAIAHEPKLAGLARRLGQVAVPAHASAAVLRAAMRPRPRPRPRAGRRRRRRGRRGASVRSSCCGCSSATASPTPRRSSPACPSPTGRAPGERRSPIRDVGRCHVRASGRS